MKIHYTYRIDHPVHGFYFGVRSSKVSPDLDTNYWSSSVVVKSLREVCPDGWKKTILAIHPDRETAAEHEYSLTPLSVVNDWYCLNRVCGGKGYRQISELTRQKMSASRTGKRQSAEAKAKISAAKRLNPGRSHLHTAESKAKLSAAHTGKKFSDAHKAALTAKKLGSKYSFRHKNKAVATRAKNVISKVWDDLFAGWAI